MKFENREEIFLVSHCFCFLCVNALSTLSATQLVSAFLRNVVPAIEVHSLESNAKYNRHSKSN